MGERRDVMGGYVIGHPLGLVVERLQRRLGVLLRVGHQDHGVRVGLAQVDGYVEADRGHHVGKAVGDRTDLDVINAVHEGRRADQGDDIAHRIVGEEVVDAFGQWDSVLAERYG